MFKNINLSNNNSLLEFNDVFLFDHSIKKFYKFKINKSYNNNLYFFKLNTSNRNANKVRISIKNLNNKLAFYQFYLKDNNFNSKKVTIIKKKIKNYKLSLYHYKTTKLFDKINYYGSLFNVNNSSILSRINKRILYQHVKAKFKKQYVRFFIRINKFYYYINHINFINNYFYRIKRILFIYKNSFNKKKKYILNSNILQNLIYKTFKYVFFFKKVAYFKNKNHIFGFLKHFLKNVKYKRYYKRIKLFTKYFFDTKKIKKIEQQLFLKYCKWFSVFFINVLLFSKISKKKFNFFFSLLHYDFYFLNTVIFSYTNKVNNFLKKKCFYTELHKIKKEHKYRFRKYKKNINKLKYMKCFSRKSYFMKTDKNINQNILYNLLMRNKDDLIKNNTIKYNILFKNNLNSIKIEKFRKRNKNIKINNVKDLYFCNKENILNLLFYLTKKMNLIISLLSNLQKYIHNSDTSLIFIFFKKIKKYFYYYEYLIKKYAGVYFLKKKDVFDKEKNNDVFFLKFVNNLNLKYITLNNNKSDNINKKLNNEFFIFNQFMMNYCLDDLSVNDKQIMLEDILTKYVNLCIYVKRNIERDNILTDNRYYLILYRNFYFLKKNIMKYFFINIFNKKSNEVRLNLMNRYLFPFKFNKRRFIRNRLNLKLIRNKQGMFKKINFLGNYLNNLELYKIYLINRPLHVISHITTKNYRYHILDHKYKLLCSESLGTLGIDRKEMKLKKSKIEMGDVFLRDIKSVFVKNKEDYIFNELHFHLIKYKFPAKYIFKEFRKYIRKKIYKYYKKKKTHYMRKFKRSFLFNYYLEYYLRYKLYKKGIRLYNKKYKSFY